jgi:transmembrane sensor
MNPYEHIDELIAKHLAKETSAEEEEILHNWIVNSEDSNAYYSEMKVIYEAAAKKAVEGKINVDAAWNTFSKRLQESETKKPIIKRLTLAFFSRAALFIFMASLAYFMYNRLSHQEKLIVLSSSASATYNHTLPDKTFVSLYPKSSIAYTSTFNKTNRELKLSGEAYFHVQHREDLPFIINAEKVFIKDIGTTFTVKAQPSDSTVMVHVIEGEVIFYSFQHAGITLLKNETGIYNQISQAFRKKDHHFAEPEVNQTLSFESARLRLVIDTLNKVYHEHILLSCKKLESLELTAAFKEKTAIPIVETIAETFGLSVTSVNGTIILNGKDCKEQAIFN